jgi:hypothetical protein
MKTNVAVIFFILIARLLSAQDTIVKTSNEIIEAKILEINNSEIKYKKFSFLDGPTYVESKTNILYIKYHNGLKEQFNDETGKPQNGLGQEKIKPKEELTSNADYYSPGETFPTSGTIKIEQLGKKYKYKYQGKIINEKAMQSVLIKTQDKQIVALAQSAKDARTFSYIGYAVVPLGLASMIILSQPRLTDGGFATGTVLFFGAIACPIVSGIYSHKRKVANHKAVELYNQKY